MDKKLKGLGGWLILPILVLFYNLYVLVDDISSTILRVDVSVLWWVLLIDVVLIILTILLLLLIFEKRKVVPSFYIWYIWLILATNIAIFVMYGEASVFSFNLIGAVIWTAYFNTSIRVKNTFVNKGSLFVYAWKIMIPFIVILLILFGIGFSAISSDSFDIIIEDSSYVFQGYHDAHGFEMFVSAPISISFSSNDISDILLFDEENYNRFNSENEEDYLETEWLEGAFEVSSFNKRGIFLEEGTYYFIVFATNNSVNYNLSILIDE